MTTTISGTATDNGSTTTTIHMAVTGDPDLTAVAVAKHLPDRDFRGTYAPTAANLFVSADEFSDIAAQLASAIEISVTYDENLTTNNVTRFCYNTTCISAQDQLRAAATMSSGAAPSESTTVAPPSNVHRTDSATAEVEAATGTNER